MPMTAGKTAFKTTKHKEINTYIMKKLPEKFNYKPEDSDEVLQQDFDEFVTNVVKHKKVKAIKDEARNEIKSAAQVVRWLAEKHLNDSEGTFELPEELENLASVSDFIRDQMAEHVKCTESLKASKDAEKEAKRQEREAAKAEKEAEDKAYQESQDKFSERMAAAAKKHEKKAEAQFKNALNNIDLPKSISFSPNGMGIVVSKDASKDDIAVATSAIVGGLEGSANTAAALQFALGDMINASVGKGNIFRTKNDAAEGVKLVVSDKLNKRFHIGTLQYYATMAERIPASKRQIGISPSIYLEASKVVAPKLKEGTKEEQEKIAEKFDSLREEIIDKINSGELSGVKDVKKYVIEHKMKDGIALGKSNENIRLILNQFFYAYWIKENLEHVDGKYTFKADKDSPATVEYTVGEVTDYMEQAQNSLQNILLAKYDIPALIKGTVTKGKGDKSEEVPYLLIDPFQKNEAKAPESNEEKSDE